MSEGQGEVGEPGPSPGRRPGRPRQDHQRRPKMLNEGTPHMCRTALQMLRQTLDLAAVAKACGFTAKTARDDWNGSKSNKLPDKFIITFARKQLYGMDAPWINDVWSRIVQQWPLDGRSAQDKFIAAISTIYREMLERPETIARWQIHLYVAAALRSDVSADDDEKLMNELIDLRHQFDDHVTRLWHLPLRVVLAEMERRPRAGINERTIARELHTSMDGHVLRRLAEGQPFDEDDARAVGWHTLLLLEGFTEEDTPPAQPPPHDLDGWVRDKAAHEAVRLHRSRPSDVSGGRDDRDGDDHGRHGDRREAPANTADADTDADAAVERDEVLRSVLDGCPQGQHADVQRVFDELFADIQALREAALRRCLERRIEAVWELYEAIPAPVLRQLVSSIRSIGRTDDLLLRECRNDRLQGSPSYLAELEDLLRRLLVKIGTNSPGEVAGVLLEQTLDGDHKAVEGLLKVIVPDADERELARLQAAAADQLG